MLSISSALEIAKVQVKKLERPEFPFQIDESVTMERPYGWIFFYNTEKYFQTKMPQYKLAGNAPLAINSSTGEWKFLKGGVSFEKALVIFEEKISTGKPWAETDWT